MHLATAQTDEGPKVEQLSVSEVRPEQLLGVWPKVVPYLKRALRHGQGDETNPECVLAALLQQHSFMWIVHDEARFVGAVIYRVVDHDTCRKIWLDFIVGVDFAEWIDQIEDLLGEYKDIVGAKCIEASCRPGMERLLVRRGHKRKAVIMEFNK